MGTFRYSIPLYSLDGSQSRRVDALVDTGATYTWLPQPVLEGLGYRPVFRRRLRLADGTVIELDGTEIVVEIDGAHLTTVVIFGDLGSESLLGAVTLEQFSLAPDPVEALLMLCQSASPLDAGGGERIPTLAEVIDFCHDEGLGLYVELKAPDTARAVVETLRRGQAPDLVIIGSFCHDWVRAVKTLASNVPTSVLFRAVDADPVILARTVGADYVHPCWEHSAPEPHRLLTAEWIERVRAAGLGLITWHEERFEEIAALRQRGVDGICSAVPELLQPAP